MADVDVGQRMSRIRQRGTSAELRVGAALRSAGHRYRKNVKSLPGSPDFANRSKRWAIFVNGCYWHHHTGCARATVPKANRPFWEEKFRANRSRDARAIKTLRAMGFRVSVIWECETGNLGSRLSKILEPRGIGGGKS